MIKQNLHTHSTYCDGKDTIEEMVLTAIEKGFTVLGFSGHGYNHPIDECSMDDERTKLYINDVLNAKEKYKDEIKIYLGIEQDSIGRTFEKKNPYDYILGSVHFVPYKDTYLAVDYDKETTERLLHEEYHNNFIEYAKAYYEEVKKLAKKPEVDIIGHVDLLMKYNEDESFIKFDDKEYLNLAYACIDELINSNKIIEVNTGAIARGMRKTPYPHKTLLEYIFQKEGKICLNSDCHNRQNLDQSFEESLKLIRSCGFTSMMELTEEGFKERSIDEFK